jgi:hypothetical protein
LRALLSVFGPLSALFFICLRVVWWLFAACFTPTHYQFSARLRRLDDPFRLPRFLRKRPRDR